MPIYRMYWLSALIVLVLGHLPAWAQNDGISAFAGLQMVNQEYGSESMGDIVRMEGSEGQTQPLIWNLVVHRPSEAKLLQTFLIGNGKVLDQGGNDALYLERPPAGFLDWDKLQIDSTAAFRILDTEARAVNMGFDKVSYVLRCKEFTQEPVWELTVMDQAGAIVGRVQLSAATGSVLRTIWYYWGTERTETPQIVDSALGGGKLPAALPYQPGSTPNPPAVPGTVSAPTNPTDPKNMPASNRPIVEVGPAEAPVGGPPRALRPAIRPGSLTPYAPNQPGVATTVPGRTGTITMPPQPAGTLPSLPGSAPSLPPSVPADLRTSPRGAVPAGRPANISVIDGPESDRIEVLPLPPRPVPPAPPAAPVTPGN